MVTNRNVYRIRGRLDPFAETGTEGVIWAVHDTTLPGYDGLHILRNGDYLKVADRWEGRIKFEYKRNEKQGQQAVHGFWVHGFQVDMEPEEWADMFFARPTPRAMLIPVKKPPGHPFHGDSRGMEIRLRRYLIRHLDDKGTQELFRATIYPWLYFYANGEWHSLARDWGFTMDETITLIGASEPQVQRWKATNPKRSTDTLMPFEWSLFIRLALLFGIYGAIDWQFDDSQGKIDWLAGENKRLLLQPDLDGIRQVRDHILGIVEQDDSWQ